MSARELLIIGLISTAIWLTAHRELLFLGTFAAVNLTIPSSRLDHQIAALASTSTWYEGWLGVPNHLVGAQTFLNLLLWLASGGNQSVLEKLLLAYPIIGAMAMYLFSRRRLELSTVAAAIGSIIFGFGPSVAEDFTDITLWGYALLPLAIDCFFDVLDSKRIKWAGILGLGFLGAFITDFAPQLLVASPLLLLPVLFAEIGRQPSQKMKFVVTRTARLAIAGAVILILSANAAHGIKAFMLARSGVNAASVVTEVLGPFGIYYKDATLINSVRLVAGTMFPREYMMDNPWGFGVAVIAIMSLLLVRERRHAPLVISLALSAIAVQIFLLGGAVGANWFAWLGVHVPLITVLVAPQRPLMLASFAYVSMLAIAFDTLRAWMARCEIKVRSFVVPRRFLTAALVVCLLVVNFLYFPAFSSTAQSYLFYPLPDVFEKIQDWLVQYDHSNYRILLVPWYGQQVIAGNPGQLSAGAFGIGSDLVTNYVNYIFQQIAGDRTDHLGWLLAPAGVKYVIVNRHRISNIGNFADYGSHFAQKGPIKSFGATAIMGDPILFELFLDQQKDLRRIAYNPDFAVYLNEMFFGMISVYEHGLLLFGSFKILETLPNFTPQDQMVILPQLNVDTFGQLFSASDRIVFENMDFRDYLAISAGNQVGGIPKLERPLSAFGGNSTIPCITSKCATLVAPANATLQFNVPTDGQYDVWIAKASSGEVQLDVKLDHGSVLQPSVSQFRWGYVGRMHLSKGPHILELSLRRGTLIVDTVLATPVSAVYVLDNRSYLFAARLENSSTEIYTPSGEYWLTAQVNNEVMLTPEISMVQDVNDAIAYNILRPNFKASSGSTWSFDNANYLFSNNSNETRTVAIDFTGSGLVDVVISDGKEFLPYYPSTNGTLYEGYVKPFVASNSQILLLVPPGHVFQPRVYSYVKDSQNVADNISRIRVRALLDVPPTVLLDGHPIHSVVTVDGNQASLGHISLSSGLHKFSMKSLLGVQVIRLHNRHTFFPATNEPAQYIVLQASTTKYVVEIESRHPAFIGLAESYYPTWRAEHEGRPLPHFVQSMFANGFLVPPGRTEVEIVYQPSGLDMIPFLREAAWIALGTILLGLCVKRISSCRRNRNLHKQPRAP